MEPIFGRFRSYIHGLFRIVAGYTFMLHGAQKLFGVLGAEGPVDYLSLIGLAGMIGGLVISEQVFAIPGMGRLIVDAVATRDYPLIQGTLLLIAVSYVVINLLIDLTYLYFDPRIRY